MRSGITAGARHRFLFASHHFDEKVFTEGDQSVAEDDRIVVGFLHDEIETKTLKNARKNLHMHVDPNRGCISTILNIKFAGKKGLMYGKGDLLLGTLHSYQQHFAAQRERCPA